MTSAPANPEIETAKPGTQFLVWLGDDSGGTPTEEDETTALKLLEITRTAGGRSLDTAVFAYDLGETGERLVDLQTPDSWNRQLEVRVADEEGEPTAQAAFWGALSIQSIGISARDEAASVTARIEPYHFGSVCKGYHVNDPVAHDPGDGEVVLIEKDIRFNPLIDGKIEFNRGTVSSGTFRYDLWVDPESVRTATAITYQDLNVVEWELRECILALCKLLNPSETYIKNPTANDLAITLLDLDNPPVIRNVTLPRGFYLPYYLDALLEPHGFGWFLRLGFNDDGTMFRKIAVFKRGEGEERDVYLQRPGEDIDLAKSNVSDLAVETSIADLANVVTGYGSLEEREVTIELYRGWPEADDSLSCDDLDRTYPDSVFAQHQTAWRLWVANEAGDYNGLRTSVAPISATTDLASVFTRAVPCRRRLYDCLTYDENGNRRPPFIEWYDPDEADSDLRWKPLEAGSVAILNDQIGIYFTGATPPSSIVAAGEDARIRITGTIQGDARIQYQATRRPESPNGLNVELVLDLSDRFHDREVFDVFPSAFQSVLADDPNGAAERDDATALETFVKKVRDTEDAAAIRASVTLHGIHWDYEIGQVIRKVEGREISFNRFAESSETKRYLQIYGISYDRQRQQTTLTLDAADRAFIADDRLDLRDAKQRRLFQA